MATATAMKDGFVTRRLDALGHLISSGTNSKHFSATAKYLIRTTLSGRAASTLWSGSDGLTVDSISNCCPEVSSAARLPVC